jgi:hypothetical protein
LREAARDAPNKKTGIHTAEHARRHHTDKIKKRARPRNSLPPLGNGHIRRRHCASFVRSAAKLSSQSHTSKLAQPMRTATLC